MGSKRCPFQFPLSEQERAVPFQLLLKPQTLTTEPSEFNSDVWSATVKMLATSAVGTAVFMTALITAINLTPRHCGGPDGNDCPVSQPIHPDAGSAPNRK